MKTNMTCPQTEELRQLLDCSLSDDRQLECMQHMDSCPCCQARIESVATEGTNLSAIVRGIHEAEPQATSAYWPVVQAMESTVQEPVQGKATKTLRRHLPPFFETGQRLGVSWPPGSFRRDARARPWRHGRGARSVRFAASSSPSLATKNSPIRSYLATKLPTSVSAGKLGPPHRSRMRMSSRCIKSSSAEDGSALTW